MAAIEELQESLRQVLIHFGVIDKEDHPTPEEIHRLVIALKQTDRSLWTEDTV